MRFLAFGLNHESAPVKRREAFALSPETQRRLYEEVSLSEEAEYILLSTCNRTEAYLFGAKEDADAIRAALCRKAGMDWPEASAFRREDEEAVQHIIEVACGLRSLVLGETQILAQVKEAYQRAVDADRVTAVMHRLMHTAFRAAKRVVSETTLTSGAASISSAAIALARSYFDVHYPDGLEGRRVLLVGAGQMGVLALETLQEDDVGEVVVTNRTPERTEATANSFNAQVAAWEKRHEAVGAADLVIVATGAEEPVVHADPLPEQPSGRPDTLLIDIAVPRNAAPAINERPGYTVFDLDDLNERLVRVEAERRAAVPEAEEIVDDVLSEFVTWFFHQQALQPAIHALRDTFDAIREQEIERHAHRLADTDREEINRLTKSILQKLLAVPIVRLKSVDPESIDFVRGIKLLNTLFSRPGCEDETPPTSQEMASSSEEEPSERHVLRGIEQLRDDIEHYQALRTPSGDE